MAHHFNKWFFAAAVLVFGVGLNLAEHHYMLSAMISCAIGCMCAEQSGRYIQKIEQSE